MNPINLILTLVLMGFIIWLILLIPMPSAIRNIIMGIAILTIVLYILERLNIITGFPHLC